MLDETLGRLAKKAGVKATILLDRASGAILKMEGQIASIRTSIGSHSSNNNNGNSAAKDSNGSTMVDSGGGGFADDALLSNANGDDGVPADETKGARELAGLVWNYVKVSGDLVEAIDTEVSCTEEGRGGRGGKGSRFTATVVSNRSTGRIETPPVTNEEAGARHCARPEIPLDCDPRHTARLIPFSIPYHFLFFYFFALLAVSCSPKKSLVRMEWVNATSQKGREGRSGQRQILPTRAPALQA